MNGAVIGGRYELLASIGQGGMGDVYRGRDRQTGETVAIKLLKPDIVESSPELIERFEREGEALRQLNHPNIVKMLGTIEEGGLHYLVMQYVGGGSLRDLLDVQPQLPVERVLAIALELADALTRAHHLHIIHRDLKPANVLLDENGTPLLADFGVAHMATRPRVTETGSVIGTYSYLSPEACRGETLDVRTDIWSFGVMLFEMLAGHSPFGAGQATAILLAIVNDPVPDLRSLRPDVPPALVELIDGMLQKDRDARTSSVRMVGAEIEAIMRSGATPLPVTPSRGERSRFSTPTPSDVRVLATQAAGIPSDLDDLVRLADTPRHKTVSTSSEGASHSARRARSWLLALGVLALAVIALVVVVQALRGGSEGDSKTEHPVATGPVVTGPALVEPVAPGELMVLVAQFEPLEGVSERDVARFVVEDLTERLERGIAFSNVRIRAYPGVITGAADALAVAEANRAPVIVWGHYTPDGVEARVQIGSTVGIPHSPIEREVLERTANVRLGLTSERHESVALPVLTALNVLLTAEGDAFGVSHNIVMVEELDEESPPVLNGGVARVMQSAIVAYIDDAPRAVELYTSALASDQGNSLLYLYRASSYMRLGDLDHARVDIESAQRRVPDAWGSPLMLLANAATSEKDWAAAANYCTQILAANPDDWFAIAWRGALYYLMGDYPSARADLEQSLELGPRANFPFVLLSMMALREGRLADAQAVWRDMITRFPDATFSMRMLHAMYGDEFPIIFAPMLAAVGNIALGQYDEAIQSTDAALAIVPGLSDMYLVQGVSWCSLGSYEAAEAAYSRAIEFDPNLLLAYALRAEAWLRQGDMAEALKDRAVIEQSDQASVFVPLMDEALQGEWTCEQFFRYDYATLLGEAGEGSQP